VATTHRNADETRARILAAAQECFAEHGYDRASVSMICERARVTKGALYHHFASKQAIFLELLDDWLADLDARLDVFEGQGTTVPVQLLAMTGVLEHVLSMAREQLPIYLEYLIQALRDPVLRQKTAAPYDRFHNRIADLLRRGIMEGSLREMPVDAMASAILALVMGSLVQALLAPDSVDTSAQTAHSLRALLATWMTE